MKESEFIDQNKDKWSTYEKLIESGNTDPDDLRELFIQVTDDLSYSRSHYPNRSVRIYLNDLARKVFDKLSRRKPIQLEPIVTFFKTEVPQLMFLARKEMIISFLVLILSVCIGVYSSYQSPEFASQILGERYVQVTQENIQNNQPMAIYGGMNEFDSFFQILLNNARIDILILGLGLIFGVGALFILISNGIMLGVFQYFFYVNGGFQESLLTIWLHGTIEISTLALMGGVGLLAGKGLLFPGTFTRYQSFRKCAGNASKLLLAILPFTFVAAVIESFITRQSHMPDWVKLTFILLSFALIVLYFIWLPLRVNRKVGRHVEHEQLRNPEDEVPIELSLEKSVGRVISEAFILYKKQLGRNLALAAAASLLMAFSIYFFWGNHFVTPQSDFWLWIRQMVLSNQDAFNINQQATSFGLKITLIVSVGLIGTWALLNTISTLNERKMALAWQHIFITLFVIMAMGAYLYFDWIWYVAIAVNYLIVLLFCVIVAYALKSLWFKNDVRVFKAVLVQPFQIFLFYLAIMSVLIFAMMLFNSLLLVFMLSMLIDILPFAPTQIKQINTGVEIFTYLFIFFGLIPLFMNSLLLFVASAVEKSEAPGLQRALKSISINDEKVPAT